MNKEILIAACGMNCSICMVHLRKKNKCAGCRSSDQGKPITRTACRIKNCDKSGSDFCFDCAEFPCKRLIQLDTRYRTKYKMSMIENLMMIKNSGIRFFMEDEQRKWTCHSCGGTICVHKGICADCGIRI